MASFWDRLTNTPRSIAKGLRVTLAALRRTKATVRYPEQLPTPSGRSEGTTDPNDAFARPYEIAPRYRGLHGLTRNPETGDVNCIGCMACSNVCPDHLISMDLEKRDGHSGRYPVSFTVNIGPCCFCGLCSEVCPTPFRAIVMTDLYEWASYERFGTNLALTKEDLLRNGDYEVARRAAGRTFTDDGDIASILPEEEGNPYFQFAAESGKGKKKPAAEAKPAVAKPAEATPAAERVDVASAAVAQAEPPKAAEPAPAKVELGPEELRARLVELLASGGVAVPEPPEDVTLEALEAIEDRKQRSLAKVARRRLRAALGLGE
ncbi:MAG: NADH-quinone oxidoreductase subunit I [Armatimonadetes bacterium]|nr:NADH-quinone oxidoreductase subunit I [Armatimonadota bacterium]